MAKQRKGEGENAGRKGGKRFPRIDLKESVEYAKKLVSRTHTGPQPREIIFPGVFGEKGTRGEVRSSALKQYGLLEGPYSALEATKLAKGIEAATPADLPDLLRTALLNASIFKLIYDTFVGDVATVARIRQQASHLEVHPDNASDCADVFVRSAVFAGVASLDGESVTFKRTDLGGDGGAGPEERGAEGGGDKFNEQERHSTGTPEVEDDPTSGGVAPKAVIQVSVTLDSSLDTEKLEKQLKLLRKFGAI